MKKRALLITGKGGAGKSTIASIVTNYTCKAVVLPMALTLKEVARQHLGWDGEKDDRGRQLLQHLGDVGRDYNPDIWVDNSLKIWRVIASRDYDIFVADDIRYLNEYQRVSEEFGPEHVVVIRVERGNGRGLEGNLAQHRSETSYQEVPYDVLIDNNGTLVDLETEVVSYLRSISFL